MTYKSSMTRSQIIYAVAWSINMLMFSVTVFNRMLGHVLRSRLYNEHAMANVITYFIPVLAFIMIQIICIVVMDTNGDDKAGRIFLTFLPFAVTIVITL